MTAGRKIKASRVAAFAVFALVAIAAAAPAAAQFRHAFMFVPTRQSVENVWPAEARRNGVGGSAAIVCDIDVTLPANCKVISEHPADAGFGEALVRLVSVVRMRPINPPACMKLYRQLVFSAEWPLPPARRWVGWPTASDTALVYPSSAKQARLSGDAVIDCATTAGGALTDCRVAHESPAGNGFGDALLTLAPKMRLAAVDPDKAAARRVFVPMDFIPTVGGYLNCR